MRALWALQQMLAGLKVGGPRLMRGGAVGSHFIHLVSKGHMQPYPLSWQKGRRRLAASLARRLPISF